MFPLSTVLFPHAPLPLHVFEPRYRVMTERCLAADRAFGVVLIDRGSEVGGGDHRVGLGTRARIEEARRLPDGRWVLVALGVERVRVEAWLPDDPFPQAVVAPVPDGPAPGDATLREAAASVRRVHALMSELGTAPAPPAPVPADPSGPDGEARTAAAWRVCAAAPLSVLDRQRVLETDDAGARLALVAALCDELSLDVTRLLSGG